MGEEGVGGLGKGLDVLGRGCLTQARMLPESAVSRNRWGHPEEVGQIRWVTGDERGQKGKQEGGRVNEWRKTMRGRETRV